MRVCLAVFLALLAMPTQAQQAVFRAGAQTVSIYATVRDRDGRLVPGLTKADFQVLDDGRPAEITTFSNDLLPASIVMLLDMSTSMIGEEVRVRDSALRFIDALLPADRVRIGTFGDEISLSPLLTSDKAVLGRVLREEVWPGGDTPLWSAMRAAMVSLADETNRRVIVMLTDGIDTGCPRMIGGSPQPSTGASFRTTRDSAGRRAMASDDVRQRRTTFVSAQVGPPSGLGRQVLPAPNRATRCSSFGEVEKTAFENEFMVYAIGMEGLGLTGGLLKLTDETGGGHFELKRNVDLAATFAEVADELHHQYALGVTPVALDGRVHALEVRLAQPGMTARARKSYLAGAK